MQHNGFIDGHEYFAGSNNLYDNNIVYLIPRKYISIQDSEHELGGEEYYSYFGDDVSNYAKIVTHNKVEIRVIFIDIASDEPEKLREYIKNNLYPTTLGVVLIGDLNDWPFAHFDYGTLFSQIGTMELYFQDIDGDFVASDSSDSKVGSEDNPFIEHNDGSGDRGPEIWLSRICIPAIAASYRFTPEKISEQELFIAKVKVLQNYFTKGISYARSPLSSSRQSLSLLEEQEPGKKPYYEISDTMWDDKMEEWLTNDLFYKYSYILRYQERKTLELLYEERYNEYTPTSVEDLHDQLSEGYEWIFFGTHGSPDTMKFSSNFFFFAEDYLNWHNVVNQPPQPIYEDNTYFYIMGGCDLGNLEPMQDSLGPRIMSYGKNSLLLFVKGASGFWYYPAVLLDKLHSERYIMSGSAWFIYTDFLLSIPENAIHYQNPEYGNSGLILGDLSIMVR